MGSAGCLRKLTLVCTEHRENGLCNEDGLMSILKAIDPDVIFEEARPSDSLSTLEAKTIDRYLESRSARRVPIDSFVMPENFRRDAYIMEDYVNSKNIEYRELMTEINQKIHQFGYPYLNGSEFEAASNKERELFEKTIAMSGDDTLVKTLMTWNDLIRKREDSMVENVYDFCRKSSFIEGVFLVGAAHKSSIVSNIEGRINAEPNLIHWNIGKLPVI